MAPSDIDDGATALDRVTSPSRLTPATPIHVARAHLRTTGEPAAVVFRSDRPVGVVTAAALTTRSAASSADAPVTTVMDHVTVPVEPDADAKETVRTFTRAAWDWLEQRPAPRREAEQHTTDQPSHRTQCRRATRSSKRGGRIAVR
ncbi:MAG: hypothetical protein ACRD07_15750 [Acidimicrobiales bacterium]